MIMGHQSIVQLRRGILRNPSNVSSTSLTLPPEPTCVCDVHFLDEVPTSESYQNGCTLPLCVSDVYLTTVTHACVMTSGDDVKKVISLCLEVKDADKFYEPGDCIGILPCNSEVDVEEFAELLHLKNVLFKKCFISIRDGDSTKKQPFPDYMPRDASLYHILRTCVDLRAVPKKVLIRLISEYTSDDSEKRFLHELCSKEGSSLYNARIMEYGTTILDILSVFTSCSPPIEKVLGLLPRLLPRPYSIASSPLITPNEIRIVFTVVQEPQEGVCSGWLCKRVQPLIDGSSNSVELALQKKKCIQVPMYFRRSNGFHLPEDPSVPVILIGPGTGIAPFFGFLQHRTAKKKLSPEFCFGDILLFFGCRYPNRDFLFRKELEQFVKEGVITNIFTSFSRENTDDKTKYVQDNMRKHAQRFVRILLEEKGVVYVCGDGRKMAKDVWDTLIHLISSEKGISNADASALLTTLQKEGYYRQDIWF